MSAFVVRTNFLGFLDFDLVGTSQIRAKPDPLDTLQSLIKHGAKITTDHLVFALKSRCEKKVIELLIKELGESVCVNILLYALEYGNPLDTIQLLIDHGALATGFCVFLARQGNSEEITRLVEETNKKQFSLLEVQYQKKDEEKQIGTIGKKRKLISETPHGKYDYQIVFDMRPGTGQALALASKAISKGIESAILPLHDEKLLKKTLREVISRATHRSRGYLIAHCSPGADHVTGESLSGEKITKTLKEIAQLFSKATQLKTPPIDGRRFKFCLVICDGASKYEGESGDFPGQQMSIALFAGKIDAEVVAYNGAILVDVDNQRKLVEGVHHKVGSKFSFITTSKGSVAQLIR